MDEELIEFTTENNASVELEDIVESEIVAEDLEQSIETESIIEMAEAEPVEEIEIEVDEAVGWTGGDNTRHYSLYGRDEPDQHPISAITGLRGELDEIGRLKTIYSDGVGLANYYKWHDGVYDDYGYFVSLVQGTNHIQICDGADIFGVTVNMAGFAGNQTVTARGNDYALVATTGLVQVRCESDVAAGDYVVCNSVGVAEKTTSGCGYKVSAVDNSTGVSYAEVSLGVQAHVTDALKKSVQRLDDRVDEVEINVLYAMNTANAAQNMAQNAINSNGVISDQVSGALEKVESMEQQVGDLSSQVGNIESTAAQAQAVANTASTSAEAARAAAEETANKALVEAEQTRTDVNKKIDDMNVTISNAVDNVEELRETINPLVMWPEGVDPDAATGVAGFVAQANENGVVLGNLVEWKNGNGDDSLAGFVSKATADNAEIQALASYEYTDEDGEKHHGAAGIIAGVTDNKAAINAIVSDDGDLAGLQAQIDENKSAVDLVSKRVAGDYKVVGSWSEEDKDPTKIYYAKNNYTYYYFEGDYDEIEETWTGEWVSTTDAYEAGLPAAVAGIQVVTDDNSSKIENLTSWQGDTNEAMTRIEQKADENGASIQSMVANIDKYSVGEYSQSYGLTYEQAVSILTEGMIYIPTDNFFDCCGEHNGPSHCETLSHIEYTLLEEEPEDWAANYISYYRYNEEKTKYEEITDGTAPVFQLNTYYLGLEDNKINEFTPGNHYVWKKNEKDELDWFEGIGEVVFFSPEVPGQSGDLKYWYIDSSTAPEGYEPYALYIWENEQWIKVNSLEFNRENRIVSMVQQDVNGLSVEVADARGDVASLNTRLDTTDVTVNSTVAWVKGTTTEGEKLCNIAALEQEANDDGSSFALVVGSTEGNKILEGASIVLGQNGEASYFNVDADHVNFNVGNFQIDASHIIGLEAPNIDLTGYVTFTDLSESNPTTTIINGDNITTGMLKSANCVYQDGYTYTDAGTFFKLDTGELRSQNFAIDDSGNAFFKGKITATSGYIGNSSNGFTIAQDGQLEYVVGEDGLTSGWYYVTDGQYWYSFEITPETATILESGYKISFVLSDAGNAYIINDANGYYIIAGDLTKHTGGAPTDASYLSCEYNGTYYLANNQLSVTGDGSLTSGVYISPDGIGLGEGRFHVTSDGHLYAVDAEISGNITANALTANAWIESPSISGGIIKGAEFISEGKDTSLGVVKTVHVGDVDDTNGFYSDGPYSGELWFTAGDNVTGVIEGASYAQGDSSILKLGIYGPYGISLCYGLPNNAVTWLKIDEKGLWFRKAVVDANGNVVGYGNLELLT